MFTFTILTSLRSFSWHLKVWVCWEHTSWRSWPPGLFTSQWFWAAVWSRTQSRVIYTYWLPPAAPIARAEARHAWLRRIHKHPTESGLMEFPSKVTDKARHAVPDTAGAVNKISLNASMKERPRKTARWKSQLLIWVGINQLGRRSPAPLIGPCSPDDRDEDYYCPKVDTKIREAFWRRTGDVPLLQNIILPLQWGLQQNHNETLWRRPNADRVLGTAAMIWHLLMRPTCGQTAHSAAEPQHWRSSGLRELRRGQSPLTSSGADLIHKSNH